MDIETNPEALKALQDDLYRERILRSRAMTPGQRLMAAFECSNLGLQLAHGVAMKQKKLSDDAQGWEEVARRFERHRRLEAHLGAELIAN
jgi:hypothetical protein